MNNSVFYYYGSPTFNIYR